MMYVSLYDISTNTAMKTVHKPRHTTNSSGHFLHINQPVLTPRVSNSAPTGHDNVFTPSAKSYRLISGGVG